jgi:signal transduction histidine kinase
VRFATKIGLSTVAMALIVGPLLGVAVFFEARSVLREHIVDEAVQSARSIMREIDSAMHHAYQDVSMIAADALLRDAVEHPQTPVHARLMDELEERDRLTGPWKALMVFDRTGRALFGPKPLGEAKDISAYPVNKIGFDHALKGEIYYSGKIVCPETGQPFVIFAAPVYAREDAEKVVGVVIAQYAWGAIQEILDYVDPAARVHLLDQARNIVGRRSNDPHPPLRIPPLAQPEMKDGLLAYGVAASSSHGEGAALVVELQQSGMKAYLGSGWILLIERPFELAFAPISDMARNMALIVLGILLLQAAVLVVLGRLFLRPLGELVGGVRQVEQGHFDRKVTVHSKDEFGELAGSFNAMVDTLRETRDELVHKERMAMLGEVAGSMGHELRNPLGVMSNAVYFLQTMLEKADDSVKEYLGIIRDEIARSERIVAVLMDAVRTRPPEPARQEVAELVGQALRKCAVPSGVRVALDVPDSLPAVWVDEAQMHTVFENLIANAVDAMPQGGVLEIQAAVEGGREVVVGVRDTGSGIMPEDMARIFEPLFTTKARGIGLGLVVVQNLIQANGGTVKVESEAGKGTLVTVTLPAADKRGVLT